MVPFETNSSTSINGSPETSSTELSDSPDCHSGEIAESHTSGPHVTIFCDQHFNLPPSSAPLVSAEMRDQFHPMYFRNQECEKSEVAGKVAANQGGLLLPPPQALIDQPTFIPEEQKALYKKVAFILEVSELLRLSTIV